MELVRMALLLLTVVGVVTSAPQQYSTDSPQQFSSIFRIFRDGATAAANDTAVSNGTTNVGNAFGIQGVSDIETSTDISILNRSNISDIASTSDDTTPSVNEIIFPVDTTTATIDEVETESPQGSISSSTNLLIGGIRIRDESQGSIDSQSDTVSLTTVNPPVDESAVSTEETVPSIGFNFQLPAVLTALLGGGATTTTTERGDDELPRTGINANVSTYPNTGNDKSDDSDIVSHSQPFNSDLTVQTVPSSTPYIIYSNEHASHNQEDTEDDYYDTSRDIPIHNPTRDTIAPSSRVEALSSGSNPSQQVNSSYPASQGIAVASFPASSSSSINESESSSTPSDTTEYPLQSNSSSNSSSQESNAFSFGSERQSHENQFSVPTSQSATQLSSYPSISSDQSSSTRSAVASLPSPIRPSVYVVPSTFGSQSQDELPVSSAKERNVEFTTIAQSHEDLQQDEIPSTSSGSGVSTLTNVPVKVSPLFSR